MATEWFYFKGEQRIGPVSSTQLKENASSGTLQPTDFVWREGMPKPQPASKVKGLFDQIEENSPKKSSDEQPKSQVDEPPSNQQTPLNEQAEKSSGADWYYAQEDQQIGPVGLPQLQELARSGKLQPSDLVWHEALPEWVPASRIVDLFSPSDLMKLKGVFGGTVEVFKQGWFENQQKPTSDASKESKLDAPSSEKKVPIVAEVAAPPRLPLAISLDDVIIQSQVAYRGGHPQRTDATDGRLYLANNGLHFIAHDPIHDFTIIYGQILDILTPVTGSFSAEMIAKSESARSLSTAGRHLSNFAGSLVGGVGGAAIRAIGSTATGVSASQSSLGIPPKNRLVVVTIDGTVRHKLVFDVMSPDKTEMEQQAEAFWRKVATVRSHFFSGNPRQNPPPLQPTGGNTPHQSRTAQPIQNTSTGFFVSKGGIVSGPHSGVDIQTMRKSGMLSAHDSIRIEVWVPFETFSLLNTTNSNGVASVLSPAAHANQNSYMPQQSAASTSINKSQRSVASTIAAGVGGLAAGAVATSLLTPAHAAQIPRSSHHDESQIKGIVLDSNRDGVADAVGLDTNHDGRIDTVGVDLNHDGHIDAVGVDINHDGHADAVGVDFDGDGHLDAFGFDTNHDGTLDTYGVDLDGDGNIDFVEHDYDQDGQLDDFDSFGGVEV